MMQHASQLANRCSGNVTLRETARSAPNAEIKRRNVKREQCPYNKSR